MAVTSSLSQTAVEFSGVNSNQGEVQTEHQPCLLIWLPPFTTRLGESSPGHRGRLPEGHGPAR